MTTLLNYCKINIEIDTRAVCRMPETAPRCGARSGMRGDVGVIRAGIMWVLALTVIAGCAAGGPYSVAVAEERMVRHCTPIGTLSENSDMGAFQIHPKLTYDGRYMVLRRV